MWHLRKSHDRDGLHWQPSEWEDPGSEQRERVMERGENDGVNTANT